MGCVVKEKATVEVDKNIEDEKRSDMETWQMEGEVINPNFPQPSRKTVELWKKFVSSVYSHPNLLVHPDVYCIRQLFGILGTGIPYESQNLMIQLEGELNRFTDDTAHEVQPVTISCEEPQLKFVFGHVEDIQIIPHLNVAIIREYSVMDEFKTALFELFELVNHFPEVLLYPDYTFLYDFLLKFGVAAEVITYDICRTQLRRAKSMFPASSLLLIQGEPELNTESVRDSEDMNEKDEGFEMENGNALSSHIQEGSEVDSIKSTRSRRSIRQSSYYSGGDSGLGSLDQQEHSSSTAESDTDIEDMKDKKPTKQRKNKCKVKKEDLGKSSHGGRLRRFKCTACPMRFFAKYTCNRHIERSHPGAKIIYVFKRKSNVRDPSFIPPVFCSVCGKYYTSKGTCRTHIVRYHPKVRNATPKVNPALHLKLEEAPRNLPRAPRNLPRTPKNLPRAPKTIPHALAKTVGRNVKTLKSRKRKTRQGSKNRKKLSIMESNGSKNVKFSTKRKRCRKKKAYCNNSKKKKTGETFQTEKVYHTRSVQKSRNGIRNLQHNKASTSEDVFTSNQKRKNFENDTQFLLNKNFFSPKCVKRSSILTHKEF